MKTKTILIITLLGLNKLGFSSEIVQPVCPSTHPIFDKKLKGCITLELEKKIAIEAEMKAMRKEIAEMRKKQKSKTVEIKMPVVAK